MKLATIIATTLLALILTSCSPKEVPAKRIDINTPEVEITNAATDMSFDEWVAQDVQWPEWAAPVEFDLSKNPYIYPALPHNSINFDDVKKSVGEYRYLIEKFPEYDEETTPNYYGYRDEIVFNVELLGAYHAAYVFSKELEVISPDTVISKRSFEEDSDETEEVSFEELGYNGTPSSSTIKVQFMAMVDAGYYKEANELYNEQIKENIADKNRTNSGLAQKVAWSLHRMGDTEQAKQIFAYWIEDQGKDYDALATTTTACAFYYSIGEYDKVIEISEYFVNKGADAVVAAEEYYDGDTESNYFRDHWESAHAIIQAYITLATEAKNGNVVDLANLKDGTYTSSLRGFRLAPIDVTVVITAGKIADVSVSQVESKGMPIEDRAGGALLIIPQSVVEDQTFDVDAVSSATISSESVKVSVTNALLQASK